VTPWRGTFVKEADPLIIRELTERGLMYAAGTYLHTYPFCWALQDATALLCPRHVVHPDLAPQGRPGKTITNSSAGIPITSKTGDSATARQ